MNKAQLVAALADRLGDRGTATLAVDELLDVIVRTVQAGEPVSIIGFGVFECRGRAARVARNPRTGVAIEVAATNVPAFRAGAGFRAAVSGARALPAQDAPAATGKTDAGEPADNGGSKPGKALAKAAGKGPDKSSAKTGGKNKERGKHKDGGKGPDKGAKGGDKGAAKDKSGVKKSSNGRERKKG